MCIRDRIYSSFLKIKEIQAFYALLLSGSSLKSTFLLQPHVYEEIKTKINFNSSHQNLMKSLSIQKADEPFDSCMKVTRSLIWRLLKEAGYLKAMSSPSGCYLFSCIFRDKIDQPDLFLFISNSGIVSTKCSSLVSFRKLTEAIPTKEAKLKQIIGFNPVTSVKASTIIDAGDPPTNLPTDKQRHSPIDLTGVGYNSMI
eukprot:TRINITY_DN30784_c0_g1_i1.p2 TRINITY_DN30784_c0_g1~~TRINITY_DN30784_c0_g1_i1.p2  ORF type:complete len:218 (+),score=11.68 TRINITY_DN30784_c0_g1_i1:60-656(+)